MLALCRIRAATASSFSSLARSLATAFSYFLRSLATLAAALAFAFSLFYTSSCSFCSFLYSLVAPLSISSFLLQLQLPLFVLRCVPLLLCTPAMLKSVTACSLIEVAAFFRFLAWMIFGQGQKVTDILCIMCLQLCSKSQIYLDMLLVFIVRTLFWIWDIYKIMCVQALRCFTCSPWRSDSRCTYRCWSGPIASLIPIGVYSIEAVVGLFGTPSTP